MNENDFFQVKEQKAPWYLTPDVKPPKDYNPYSEAKCDAPTQNISEPQRMPWETYEMYENKKRYALANEKLRLTANRKHTVNALFFPLLLTLIMINAFSSSVYLLEGSVSDKLFSILCNIQQVLCYAALFPVTFYVYSVGKKCKTYTFFQKPVASKAYIARWCLIIFGITHLTATLFDLLFALFEKLGLHTNELTSLSHDTPLETVLYFLAVVICAPVFEELLFRGFLITGLRRFGSWFAIITSGLVFGLYHQNHYQFFFAAAFGILTGYMALRTQSVIPGIIAHVFLNGYSFIVELLSSFAVIDGSTVLDPNFHIDAPVAITVLISIFDILSYVLMLAGLVMLIMEIILNKTEFSFKDEDGKLSFGSGLKLLISSPVSLILIVLLISNLITVSFVDLEQITAELSTLAQ